MSVEEGNPDVWAVNINPDHVAWWRYSELRNVGSPSA